MRPRCILRVNEMKLDFRTKLLMTVVISFVLLFGNLQRNYPIIGLIVTFLPYAFLLLERKVSKALKGASLMIFALVLQYYAGLHAFSGIGASVVLFFSIIVLRMGPGLAMGEYSLLTTTMSDLIASLKKMKCPDSLIIPLSVMFRFFYTVKEDYRQIKEAMYLQGLVTSQFFRQPLRMIEYRFVPLLMCLSRTADDVAISATTRGMAVGQERSSISKSRLRILDYFWMFAMLTILILMIWS